MDKAKTFMFGEAMVPRGDRALLVLLFCAALGCAGCRGRPEVPILNFHRVITGPGPLDVSPALFAAQLDALRAAGFSTVSLHDAIDANRAKPLPARPIVLTFDDGTRDAITNVLPALRSRGMTATFFVVSSWIGADEAHRQASPAGSDAPSSPILVWPELLELQKDGMEIGSHSRTHARLPDLDDAAALAELRSSREEFERGLGHPIDLLAWPYNSVRARTRELAAEAGYRAAVAGRDHGSGDLLSLYRIGVYRETQPEALVHDALTNQR